MPTWASRPSYGWPVLHAALRGPRAGRDARAVQGASLRLHAKNIFEEGELSPEATVKESLTVQTEGGREVTRAISYYNLDLILAIGFRVCSLRGTQFRSWKAKAFDLESDDRQLWRTLTHKNILDFSK